MHDDSSALVQQWTCLELTNGQAWYKGVNLNLSIMENPRVKSLFESSNSTSLKEISDIKMVQDSLMYVLDETILVRHDFSDVTKSLICLFDEPIKQLMVHKKKVWVVL